MNGPFGPADHHDIILLLIQLAVLLAAARFFGEISLRLGQPSVIGELLAGILLGPSVLSGMIPAVGDILIPHTPVQGYLLEVVALMGALFLLLITGLETDIGLIRRQARTAVGVSLGGISLTFGLGVVVGFLLPDDLLVDPTQRLVFALFVAISLAISAIPVIAKVLFDLKLIRRDIGQTILAAGMSDDTIAWIMLSIVAGLAGGQAITAGGIAQSVLSVVAFLGLSFTVGLWIVRRLFSLTQNRMISRDRILTLVIVLMFAWAAFGQALNLEAVLGALIIGVLLNQARVISSDITHTLEKIAMGVFAPIFFAVAGLKVDLISLLQPRLLLISAGVIIVAVFGKLVGAYVGARLIGKRDHWTALSFGAGLNARGAMQIIVGSIGLDLGILSQDMFSILVLMALVTTLAAPFALRWSLRHVTPSEEELARLKKEELAEGSLLANVRRVLLPVRSRPDSGLAHSTEARILERLNARSPLSVTLMSVSKPALRAEATQFLDKLAPLFTEESVTKKIVDGDNVGNVILAEAEKDYDLMVLGSPERNGNTQVLFTPIVDMLMRSSPCPTILVRGGDAPEDWSPRRILVPSNGSLAARRAAEVAFALSDPGETNVFILQVVERTTQDYMLDAQGEITARQLNAAARSVDVLRELGVAQGIQTNAEIRQHRNPEKVILEFAQEMEADLIVLGTNISIGSDQLYLGPRVERILANSGCPVIVVNA
jgi:Kef-type K+ transport system membrane component KefB/nucleotide-binding universal stress UspA family protein